MNGSRGPHDPTRWKEGGTDLAGVAGALQALGQQQGSAQLVARLGARLAEPLAAGSVASGGTVVPVGGSLAKRAWPWCTAALIGVVAMYMLPKGSDRVPVAGRTTLPEATNGLAVVAQPSPSSAPPTTDVAPSPAQPAVLTPRKNSTSSASSRARATARTTASPEAELALLREAQDQLNRSARAALPLLDQHAHDYPHGLFVQEREMLRIEAELTLGLRVRALTRAKQFSERFATSTYRSRIEALVRAYAALKVREPEPLERTE